MNNNNQNNYNKPMNEFEAREYIKQKGIQANSLEDLFELIKEVKENFNYDYGVAPRTIGEICARLANYLSNEMGLTGFQAGFVMWTFIESYMYPNNKCGMKILDYDDMLYPQYEDKFKGSIIPKYTWGNIQKQAKEKIEKDSNFASPSVIRHWESISNGNVPFNCIIE